MKTFKKRIEELPNELFVELQAVVDKYNEQKDIKITNVKFNLINPPEHFISLRPTGNIREFSCYRTPSGRVVCR